MLTYSSFVLVQTVANVCHIVNHNGLVEKQLSAKYSKNPKAHKQIPYINLNTFKCDENQERGR